MDDAIPAVVELAFDKVCEYVQIDNLPLTPGHVKKRLKGFFSGWHVTVSASLFLAVCVLTVNVILVIWGACRNLSPLGGDIWVIFKGPCSQMQQIFTWSHVGINILSSLLLAASNSSCQVLSAPTRKEIDVAHSHGIWLDIGVPSFRNLRHIAVKRVVIYVLLALSSIPLHLIYNSVIFPTTSVNSSQVALVGSQLLRTKAFETDSPHQAVGKIRQAVGALQAEGLTNGLTFLSNTDCIQQFTSQFVSQYSNFIIVADEPTSINATVGLVERFYRDGLSAYGGTTPAGDIGWLCSHYSGYRCNATDVIKTPQDWKMYPTGSARSHDRKGPRKPLSIDHCLAKSSTPRCTISMSRSLLVVVIVCNVVKIVCFLMVIRWADDKPLVTVGDSIASFLAKPDFSTRDMGPLSALDGKRHFWFAASGAKRWAVALTCYLIFYVPSTLLPFVSEWQNSGITGFGSISEFGNLDPNRLIRFAELWSLTANVIFVNLPQLVVSICYISYNTILTGSLQASEYSDFGKHRKTLRVTSNSMSQRSTYWLQIPYRYAIPQMITWIVLHWLVSQSIFLARINVYGYPDGKESLLPSQSINGCGYSPIPVLMTVVLAGVMILALIGMGFRRYPANVPIVATCTAAIAASCHGAAAMGEGEDVTHKPLMYGVLRSSECYREVGKIQRVGFSAEEVDPLVKGQIYL